MSRVIRITVRAVAGIASLGLGISIITACAAASGMLTTKTRSVRHRPLLSLAVAVLRLPTPRGNKP